MLLLLLLGSLTIVFYIWQRRTLSFWERHGVKYIRPVPVVGCTREFLTAKVPFFEQIQKFHEAPGFENEPFVGVYMTHRPALVIRDLELIKTVMIKSFNTSTTASFKLTRTTTRLAITTSSLHEAQDGGNCAQKSLRFLHLARSSKCIL